MSGIVSTIDPAMSIPQLIEIVKHSFRESEFNEVQRILMDREAKMKTEIENLQKGYVTAKKGADLLEMSQKVAEADKLNLEKEIALLKRQKVEADEKLKNYIIRFENRMRKLEGTLADIFNVEVEDLAAIANSVLESDDDTPAAAAEGGVNSGDRNSVHSSTNAARTSSALQSGETLPHLEPQLPGDRNLVHSSAKDNGANTSRTSRGSQSGGSHPHVEPQVPVDINSVQSSTNATRTSALPQVPDLTEICDAVDETNLTAKRKRKRSTYISSDEEDENILVNGKEIQDPESTHDRITPLNGAPTKPSTICDDSQTHDISSDSEDNSSCSDDYMNNLIATLSRK